MPPMSGKIAWSRQLYRHIEQPMELLKGKELLLGTSLGRMVVKKYNRIALVLTEYEILHYRSWVRIIELTQKYLQVSRLCICSQTCVTPHPEMGCHLYMAVIG